jgi:hypothetical protein
LKPVPVDPTIAAGITVQSMMSLLVTVTDFAKLSVTIIQGLRPCPGVEISATIKLVAADGAGSV